MFGSTEYIWSDIVDSYSLIFVLKVIITDIPLRLNAVFTVDSQMSTFEKRNRLILFLAKFVIFLAVLWIGLTKQSMCFHLLVSNS